MTATRRYKRHFIILDNEDMGFSRDNNNLPKGYVKIEIRNGKGNMGIYLQDLKYFQNGEYIYRNYLIDTKDKTYVDMGSVIINHKGKGEHRRKLNPDNVEGSGKKIEDFNVVAIVAEPLNKPNNNKKLCPLVGFINKANNEWKFVLSENPKENANGVLEEEKKDDINNEMDNLEIKEIKEEEKEKIESNEKAVEEVEEEAESLKEDEVSSKEPLEIEYQEKYKKIMEAIEKGSKELYEVKEEDVSQEELEENEEMKEPEELAGEEEKNGIEEAEDNQEFEKEEKPKENDEVNVAEENDKAEVSEEDHKTQNMNKKNKEKEPLNYYNKYHDMVHKYIKDMLKNKEEVEPFENNLDNCRWWKMNYSKENMYRSFLPFFGYILNIYYYNPYIFYMNNCGNLMEKYGHYIFGICCNENNMPKYYIYGVPGRYLYKEQPFRGMTGFVYWHPIEDKEPKRGDYGYWLLHIDAKTGNVVFPYQPTIPPMY